MQRSKLVGSILVAFLIGFAIISAHFQANAADDYSGFTVKGRFLYDKNGDQFVPVGVNKMVIWTDIDGLPSFEEIAKTGANAVRIVWTSDGSAAQLDTAIYNCRANSMVPIVEHHGATGAWSDLQKCVDYWLSDAVLAVLKKHQEYLIVNIANECGDSSVTASDFRTKYIDVVQQMREAGLHMPLMIDAPNWGQNINILQSEGSALVEADPDHNLLLSIHMWWPAMYGYTAQTVIDEIAESVQLELPLIVGEFGGRWEESEQGQIPYTTIIEQCYQNKIGWLAWSWGPGNNPQTFLDMTDDSTYATLHDWGLEVAVSNQYSIKNTAVRPDWLLEENTTPSPGASVTASNSPAVTATPANSTAVTATPTKTPVVTSTPSASQGTGCALNYAMNDWGSGATVSITIKNNGTAAIAGWNLAFSFSGDQKITNLWCGTYTQSGTEVTISNQTWNAAIPAGGLVTLGFNISYSGSNIEPTGFTLNGAACTVN